jgi:Uma2 family endonuclease
MSTMPKTYTADELLAMPRDGMRRELMRGELRVKPPAGFDHGSRGMRLAWRLAQYVEDRKLGEVTLAETGFKLPTAPDTVLAPDCAFVSNERLAKTPRKPGFFEGAPDLAVEVLSPGDTAEEVDEKIQEWLAAGVRLLWVVNPKTRTISVYRKGSLAVLRVGETLDGEDVVPGLKCAVADVVGEE